MLSVVLSPALPIDADTFSSFFLFIVGRRYLLMTMERTDLLTKYSIVRAADN